MKIGIVSTFNVECGIATYAEHLTEHYPIGDTIIFGNHLGVLTDTCSSNFHPIVRCWERTGDFKELEKEIIDSGVDLVHFQHEFGLFQNNDAFVGLLKNLKERHIGVAITLHTVFAEKENNKRIYEMMQYCNRIIVHHQDAKNALDSHDVYVIPHGSVEVKAKPRNVSRQKLQIPEDKIVCLSLGFITPTKGAMDNISSVLRLKEDYDGRLMLIIVGMPVVHNNNYANLEYCLRLYKRVEAMKAFDTVKILPKFVSASDIDYYAGACDVMIENYYQTQYSISGMSHLVMSYGIPNISSRSRILADLDESRSLKYDFGNIGQMTDQLNKLLKNKLLREQISRNCLQYAKQTSWPNVAKTHLEYYNGIPHKGNTTRWN